MTIHQSSSVIDASRLRRIFKGSTRAAAVRAGELLTAFELEACADRNVATYSGGQRRRLDVALRSLGRAVS